VPGYRFMSFVTGTAAGGKVTPIEGEQLKVRVAVIAWKSAEHRSEWAMLWADARMIRR
jgi:uncharacterized protein (DUF1330 family)